MSITTEKDLESLRKIGKIVARCLQHMHSQLEPGITTGELDGIGGKFLDFHGARSAPKLTYNFPGFTCISVNEEAAHGIPWFKDFTRRRPCKYRRISGTRRLFCRYRWFGHYSTTVKTLFANLHGG
jgi:hypothetical protein